MQGSNIYLWKKVKESSPNTDLAIAACRKSTRLKQLDFLLTSCPAHMYSPLPHGPASFEDAGTWMQLWLIT